jgi:hypothetical protein
MSNPWICMSKKGNCYKLTSDPSHWKNQINEIEEKIEKQKKKYNFIFRTIKM